MRQRRKLSSGLSAVALALVLTGCGAAQESAPVVVGSLPPVPPAAAPTAQTPVTSAAATTSSAQPAASPTAVPAVDPLADQALIDHTEWTDDPDGRRLHVYPTQAGRTDTFPAAGDRAWQEVLTDAPDADTPGMYDQFKCHWEYARVVQPDKPSWNLEPWRPAVGYQATVAALCNPGGPER
ncbi:DUF2599 domain-containing protein [Nocardia sp. NPDC088792]|uniref:DUF2599 domain-containing protein n=1 Tax=Nocardia sp. NPDC088792 TaxID=3364332 RepID=UPI0037F92140